MLLHKFEVGVFATNCYIVGCDKTKEVAVIDPGGGCGNIMSAIEKHNLSVKYIINTHGHLDHTFENKKIKDTTGAKIIIHKDDAKMLHDPKSNFSYLMGLVFKSPPADETLEDGDIITIGRMKLKVLHTPGHTKGGISLQVDEVIFSGDTLFADGVGRTDLPGGSHEELLLSIKNKILIYPDETIVYPGHGPYTTVGEERKGNPFLTGGYC